MPREGYPRYEIFQKRTLLGLKWFWRTQAGNYEFEARSTQGYHNYEDCLRSINNNMKLGRDAPVINLKTGEAVDIDGWLMDTVIG